MFIGEDCGSMMMNLQRRRFQIVFEHWRFAHGDTIVFTSSYIEKWVTKEYGICVFKGKETGKSQNSSDDILATR